jgi:hypothetical protein
MQLGLDVANTLSKIREKNVKNALLSFGLFLTLDVGGSVRFVGPAGRLFSDNVVSNGAGVANATDSQLLNPWGISALHGQDSWIADNNRGVSMLYDQDGNKDTGLIVTIPGAKSNPNGNCSPGCPTETVVTLTALPSPVDRSSSLSRCGSSSSNKPQISQTKVMVTGTSGSISHTSAVVVTIN